LRDEDLRAVAMTRRKFIYLLAKIGSVAGFGAGWLGNKAGFCRFVRALPMKSYPGRVKPLNDVLKKGKWSG